jgi:RecA/RadA recombinase
LKYYFKQVSQLLQPSHAIFNGELDVFLKGGITHGHITEFSGAPGLGKTQLCLQLAFSNTLHGGASNGVLYIDTEGAFNSSRCVQKITKVSVVCLVYIIFFVTY